MQSETATACFLSDEELKRCRSVRNWCENCFFSFWFPPPRLMWCAHTVCCQWDFVGEKLIKFSLSNQYACTICTCIWSCRITKRPSQTQWTFTAFILPYLILSYLVCVCVLLAFWALLLQSHCLSPSSLVSFHHLFHLLSGWAVSGGVKWDVSINTTLICSDSGGGRQRWEPNSERDPGLTHWDRGENKRPDPYAELPHETACTSATSHPFCYGISLFSFCFVFCPWESATRPSVKSLSPKWYVCVWVSLCCECLRWPCRYYSPVAS